MSMLRNIGRRYLENDATKQPDAKGPVAVNTKRRALGDITNAYTTEESKDNSNAAKKPIFASLMGMGSNSESADSSYPNTARTIEPDRDYMNRESDDIDARDAGNPLLATCYVNEMYQHFGNLERQYAVSPNYMTNQPYVNERMRSILVDWLVCFIVFLSVVPMVPDFLPSARFSLSG